VTDRITKHFTWREATRSATAQARGLANDPDAEAQGCIEITAECMESVRSLLGVRLKVTSWYRSPAVNKAVGGSKTSDHLTGYAVDFRAEGRDAKACAAQIAASPLLFDQLIWYPNQDRLHISFAPPLRNDVMTRDPFSASGYRNGLGK